jgi:Rab-like protein 2
MKEYNEAEMGKADVKLIIVGDTASGKSKLVERFLLDNFEQRQLSTYALTMYRHVARVDGKPLKVDIWDTAGQEQYNNLHPSYYFMANCCILVFDVTRKTTYDNLKRWYAEIREQCPNIPTVLVANKIDVKPEVTSKKFQFAEKNGLPFYFASAADGTNVVRIFEDCLALALQNREHPGDSYLKDVLEVLGDDEIFR